MIYSKDSKCDSVFTILSWEARFNSLEKGGFRVAVRRRVLGAGLRVGPHATPPVLASFLSRPVMFVWADVGGISCRRNPTRAAEAARVSFIGDSRDAPPELGGKQNQEEMTA